MIEQEGSDMTTKENEWVMYVRRKENIRVNEEDDGKDKRHHLQRKTRVDTEK